MQSEQLLYTTDAGMVTTVTELAMIENVLDQLCPGTLTVPVVALSLVMYNE